MENGVNFGTAYIHSRLHCAGTNEHELSQLGGLFSSFIRNGRLNVHYTRLGIHEELRDWLRCFGSGLGY